MYNSNIILLDLGKTQVLDRMQVDSEYIIFVIDTSGSMPCYACSLARSKMNEILRI